jgi:hypothetical protein
MRLLIFVLVCVIAVVVAVPLEIDIQTKAGHLQKRGTDAILADLVKAAIAFGAFVWGGSIVARRGVNYYFEKKAIIEREKLRHQLMMKAKLENPQLAALNMETSEDPK